MWCHRSPSLFFYPTLPFPPAPRASRRMDVYPGVAKEAMIYTSTTATSAFSSPSESRECTRHSTELQEWGKWGERSSFLGVGSRVLVVEILICGEGLAELPPPRHHVPELNVLPAGTSNGEAKPLAAEPSARRRCASTWPAGTGLGWCHPGRRRRAPTPAGTCRSGGAPGRTTRRWAARSWMGTGWRRRPWWSDGVTGLAVLTALACWVTGDEVALPARHAVVEQGRAQRRVVHAVPGVVQVVVPACATCVSYISYHKHACISDEVILIRTQM
jgi:hypothetical protein